MSRYNTSFAQRDTTCPTSAASLHNHWTFMTATTKQYYVTVEIKPDGTIEVIRIDAYPTFEHAHDDSKGHVNFLRQAGQRRRPYGKLETKDLLGALAAWPMQVLATVAGMRHGKLGQDEAEMKRGLRSLDGEDDPEYDDIVAAVNRCALNEAGDDDRILLAHKRRGTMYGPCERVECTKHPGEFELHRWMWGVPEDGDHTAAIESDSDAAIVASCPKCIAEDAEDET